MFHVSRHFVGESLVMTPQIPRGAPKYEDRNTRRICVSPSVEQCLMGISGEGFKASLKVMKNEDWYIYTSKSWNYIPAKDVFDHNDTDEHWFLEPTEFKLYGVVCHKEAKKGKLKITKVDNIAKKNKI